MNISKEVVKETFQQETLNITSMWLGNRFQLKGVTVRGMWGDGVSNGYKKKFHPQILAGDKEVAFVSETKCIPIV